MELELPIKLEDDVTIVSRSDDGAFLITYLKANGEEGQVYWPDRFKKYIKSNYREGKAVEMVQAYLIEQIGKG